MPTRPPLVSVCMPARNCAPYLGDAIDSVLQQSVADLELVVCDDASEDGTDEIVRKSADARVRYVRHARQLGIPANRNSCLAAARGRFIAWLDADDRFLPGALEALLDAMSRDPGIGLAHGAFEVIGADGRPLPSWPMPFERDVVEHGPTAFRELVVMNYVTAPVLVRRDCHDRVGPYATDIGPSSTDWDMWLRLALQADLAYVARPLSQYRQHGGSITTASHRPGTRLRCDAAVVAHVFDRCGAAIPDRERVETQARLALLAKSVLFARDAVARGDWVLAQDAIEAQAASAPGEVDVDGVTAALNERHELAFHRESRALLERLHRPLADTRFGARLRKVAFTDAAWERTLERIAAVVRAVVPPGSRVAAVDKWDPTLLHLSGRAGYHFPDRSSMPDGYPPDSAAAIGHLESLRRRGAAFLVFPSAAFWWLQHYAAFAAHLDAAYETAWRDDDCVIYRLAGRTA